MTDIAVNLLLEHNHGLNITKAKLEKSFESAASATDFLFQGTFYYQIYGVAMGSTSVTILAYLFISHYETLWLNTFRECEVILYRQHATC